MQKRALSLKKWVFIIPTVAFFLSMGIFPMIWSVTLSFFSWHAATGEARTFVGVRNFYEIFFRDRRFWYSLKFTLSYVGMATSIELFLGLGIASLLNKRFRFTTFFRVAYLMPMAAPPIAVAYLWRMLLHPDSGPINQILNKFGLPSVAWTTKAAIAPFSLVMCDVWEWTPFMLIAILAALQSLPQEIYDAAIVDGASKREVFIYVTLPLLMPIMVTLLLLRGIDAFKLFELVFGITGGGPGGSTDSLSYYIYHVGLSYFNMGYACSLSWVFLLIVLGIATFLLRQMRKEI